jgi:hypothetical protein
MLPALALANPAHKSELKIGDVRLTVEATSAGDTPAQQTQILECMTRQVLPAKGFAKSAQTLTRAWMKEAAESGAEATPFLLAIRVTPTMVADAAPSTLDASDLTLQLNAQDCDVQRSDDIGAIVRDGLKALREQKRTERGAAAVAKVEAERQRRRADREAEQDKRRLEAAMREFQRAIE